MLIFAAMDDSWLYTDCLDTGGFPPLLWETLRHLGFTEPPTYYYREYSEGRMPKCEMHLHIVEHPPGEEFRTKCILTHGIELWDTCQTAARRALAYYCEEYRTSVDASHAKYFPVVDQTSEIWLKKLQDIEKANPRSSTYTLISTAKYLNALDTLHRQQELAMAVSEAARKKAEAKVQELEDELVMLNTQLKDMKEQKEQCQKELQEALARSKAKKRRRRKTY